ncbi:MULTISPECIES: hypothetical protein [unclassified Bacillus (in: firmicutes)]|uniref:hypothetical protein n=1 Tax=unclassified Bacillus (in: firmicutes) TaxID=185979 RepID=UPI0008EB6C9E|nr:MULTISPECIES: hypothetical protein [unclassified Bacillus (in: firmicutes)]SFB20932.1 hypothetical protein SAMN02799634_108144 [Bacillus sp. UNCCL13]SFQ90932.1 hypothetical protein SAMN04488577_3959 [Bacillus sp. cl95]
MLNFILKGKYVWHVALKRYNEVLIEDCLCQEIRSKLHEKVHYHQYKAFDLSGKL